MLMNCFACNEDFEPFFEATLLEDRLVPVNLIDPYVRMGEFGQLPEAMQQAVLATEEGRGIYSHAYVWHRGVRCYLTDEYRGHCSNHCFNRTNQQICEPGCTICEEEDDA